MPMQPLALAQPEEHGGRQERGAVQGRSAEESCYVRMAAVQFAPHWGPDSSPAGFTASKVFPWQQATEVTM